MSLGDYVGWTLFAVAAGSHSDGHGHDLTTVQTLIFVREGYGCRTVVVSAAEVGGDLPYLEIEELSS